jgi:molybdopterin synthase catalytic subunit
VTARLHTRLTVEPLSVEDAHAFLADRGAGAAVVFTGMVRDHAEGRDVRGLTYEAFAERAEGQLAEVARGVAERWPDARAVWMEHRTGDLGIGEPSVVVGVSAPHRAAAFEAARHGIDTLKETVAIWKQEHWADGHAHWPGTD